jgi:hypothetical protein
MSVPFILTENSASIFLDFQPFTVPNTHANWDRILVILNDAEASEDDLRPLLDVAHGISNYMDGLVEYRDRAVYYDGKPLDTGLTRRIIHHMTSGLDNVAAPLIKFLENVMENPSRRATLELYEWVEKAGLPITPDGHILAYKIVNHDFMDCYSKTFDNSPGQFVSVPRNQVDEDSEQTCSYGLHVCSAAYLPQYGPSDKQVVIVKINPKDFVAIPREHSIAKARVCAYEVLQAVPPETAATFFPNAYVWEPEAVEPDFEVGEIWVDGGGDLVKITAVDDDPDDDASGAVGAEHLTGQYAGLHLTYYADGRYLSYASSDDLIELAQLYTPEVVAVGQKWLTRGGDVVEIIAVTYAHVSYLTDVGHHVSVYKPGGSYFSTGIVNDTDLIALIPQHD